MKDKTFWAILLSFLAVFALASCQGQKPAGEQGTDTPTAKSTATASAEAPKYGGQIVFAVTAAISGFDEVFIPGPGPYSATTMHLTNEELQQGDWTKGPTGANETSTIAWGTHFEKWSTGALAESWKMVDDHTIEYKIRRGVRYALNPDSEASKLVNGRELTADDVVFSINRSFNTPTSYEAINYPEGNRPKPKVAADDPWKVIVETPSGLAGPLHAAISDLVRIVPPEVVNKYGDLKDWKNSVGTGPFILKDNVQASSTTLVKNPNYWDKDPMGPGKGNQLPYLDTVKFLVIPDASTILASMRTGKVDQLRDVQLQDRASLKQTAPYLKEVQYPRTGPTIIFMRTDVKPYSDIKVRQALAMGIDRPGMVRDLYKGSANLLVTPVIPLAEFKPLTVPLEKLPKETQDLYQYNPDKAKQLLAEAGYPNGFKTELFTSSDPRIQEELALVKGYWAKIGVDVELKPTEPGALRSIQAEKKYPHMINAGLAWMTALEQRQKFFPNGAENYSRINDDRVVQAFTKMEKDYLNWDLAVQTSQEIYPYILSQAWFIQLPADNVYTMWSPWIKNYSGEWSLGQANLFDFAKWVWHDQQLQKELVK